MPYATQQDLIDRYGEARLIDLTDRDPPTGAIVAEVLDRAIADAGAVADGFLAVNYVLPLTVVPQQLLLIVCSLAFAALHVDAVPDKVAADAKTAMGLLAAIGAGTFRLDLEGVAPVPQPLAEVVFSADPRTFTRDRLRGF